MDYPYVIFYIILLVLSYKYWRERKSYIIKFSFVLAFIFFAFRAPVVGADTWDYVRYLTGERNFYNYDSRPLEPLFVVYRNFICKITTSRFVVMVINTILTMFPLYLILKKYSKNVPLSILLFCYFGGYTVYFIGLRQAFGLIPILLSLLYCLEKKGTFYYIKTFLLFLICSIIGWFFHTSSIIYAILFMASLFIPGGNKVLYIIVVLGSALTGFVLEKFNVLDFFSLILSYSFSGIDRISNYLQNSELIEDSPINILIRQTIVALVIICFMDKDVIRHPFFKLYILGVVIFNLLFSVPMIPRLVTPLLMFGAVVFTWLFGKKYMLTAKRRTVVNIIVILVLSYYTRSNFITSSHWDKYSADRLHPYYFFFQDYSDHPSVKYF